MLAYASPAKNLHVSLEPEPLTRERDDQPVMSKSKWFGVRKLRRCLWERSRTEDARTQCWCGFRSSGQIGITSSDVGQSATGETAEASVFRLPTGSAEHGGATGSGATEVRQDAGNNRLQIAIR